MPLTYKPPTTATVGQRVELARYTISTGERTLHGQRIDGVVRVTDSPSDPGGRAYLVERGLEQDGHAALTALIVDYLQQSQLRDEPAVHVPDLG